jgi:lambda family phage tail tape measure protein
MVQQLDVQRQYLETERQLNLVLAARPDLIAQVNQAFVANKIAALDAQTTMSAGFERAFLKLGQEAQNYASVAESAVMTFADRSTEAIATFVETGQLNFKAFASSLLSDIARLIIRLLVLQAIQAAVGLVAPGATTAGVVAAAAGGAAGGGGGRARGGTVQPDRSYVVG